MGGPCGNSNCSKVACVQGLNNVLAVCCGDCTGVAKNKSLQNPDKVAIQAINGTPGVDVTASNYNAIKFLPIAEEVKNLFNALCDDSNRAMMLTAVDKVTTQALLPEVEKYCTTEWFPYKPRGSDAVLFIYDKSPKPLAERLFERMVIQKAKANKQKKRKINDAKPATSKDGTVQMKEDGTVQTKADVQKKKASDKYHNNAEYKVAKLKKSKEIYKKNAGLRDKKNQLRIAHTEALALKQGVPKLSEDAFKLMRKGARAFFQTATESLPNEIVLGGSSVTGVILNEGKLAVAKAVIDSSKVMLYVLANDNKSILSAEVRKNQYDLGLYGTASENELIRKLQVNRDLILSKPDGTKLRCGSDLLIAYFDPSFLRNISRLERAHKKVIAQAIEEGLIAVTVLIQQIPATRQSTLRAEDQAMTLSKEYNNIIPMEGDTHVDGGFSKRSPFVISAAVAVTNVESSLKNGHACFTRATSTKSFLRNVEELVPTSLQVYTDATTKKSSDGNDDEYSTSDEEDEEELDVKPKAKKLKSESGLENRDQNSTTSQVKRKSAIMSNPSTSDNQEEPNKTPLEQVPLKLRGKTVTPTGVMVKDGLTKGNIKATVSTLTSVKYSNTLPESYTEKARKSRLVILGIGHDDDDKRVIARREKLQTMSSAEFAKLIKPFM